MPTPTKNPGPLVFDAVIEQSDNSGSSAFVDFPYDLKETFGIGNLVKIKSTIDGVPYRGSLAKMGGSNALLLIRSDIRKLIGKERGETVHVVVELDTEPREVEVPSDLQEMLSRHPEAGAYFEKLAYTHRKEYVQWITEAKRPETRENRLAKTVEMLLAKKTRDR